MKSWKDLLGVVRSVEENPEQFGPHTKELLSLAVIMQRTSWYSSVKKPSSLDDTVARVTSWDEALTILEDRDEVRYSVHGSIVAPCDIVENALHREPQRHQWWMAFRAWSRSAFTIDSPPEDPSWGLDKFALVLDYPVDVIEHASKEILVSDLVDCTYFREHFQWFAYGYFPCGWEGDWPDGKLRVY
ncbi:MAG: hypothetical protein IPJ61_21200 [Tessaracoccus sp.]|uniref:hypothetical protein n=1 Tax=Tessaracoccus sp. TaxID=1971211 RepID=UPI001EB2910B|nr:hypothetical protein [Tessaracoccus sp.]MBK7823506.1 hypothetical protein [Tessaracoccus sp.]